MEEIYGFSAFISVLEDFDHGILPFLFLVNIEGVSICCLERKFKDSFEITFFNFPELS